MREVRGQYVKTERSGVSAPMPVSEVRVRPSFPLWEVFSTSGQCQVVLGLERGGRFIAPEPQAPQSLPCCDLHSPLRYRAEAGWSICPVQVLVGPPEQT